MSDYIILLYRYVAFGLTINMNLLNNNNSITTYELTKLSTKHWIRSIQEKALLNIVSIYIGISYLEIN